MAWFTANVFPVLILIAFVAMHVFGHGGHGGHGGQSGHGGDNRHRNLDDAATDDTHRRAESTGSDKHQH